MTFAPPYNSEAERGILGCMMLEPEGIHEIAGRLQPEDFYGEAHQKLFAMLTQMAARREVVTAVTVDQRIRELGMMDEVGGISYVLGLSDSVPAAAGLRHYQDLVIRHASARDVMRVSQEVTALASAGDADSLAQAEALLARGPEALQRLQAREVVLAQDVIGELQDRNLQIVNGSAATYVQTGLREWDTAPDFGGISSEGVTLIIAASGMGKTTVLNSLGVCMGHIGMKVYQHGTETSAARRIGDMAAAVANVDRRAWVKWRRDGTPDDMERLWQQVNRMNEALAYVGGLPIRVTGAGLTVEQVCSRARNLYRSGQCDAVIVDYLQDFRRSTGDGLRSDRGAQVDHASSTLKELAADLPIPVIVGAQVSGEKSGVDPGAKAAAPIPQMYDVQWSSKAHQDAEEVYALYRDDYYRDRFGDKWHSKGDPGVIDIYARKRRTGRLGKLDVEFSVPGKWAGTRPRWETRHAR